MPAFWKEYSFSKTMSVYVKSRSPPQRMLLQSSCTVVQPSTNGVLSDFCNFDFQTAKTSMSWLVSILESSKNLGKYFQDSISRSLTCSEKQLVEAGKELTLQIQAVDKHWMQLSDLAEAQSTCHISIRHRDSKLLDLYCVYDRNSSYVHCIIPRQCQNVWN